MLAEQGGQEPGLVAEAADHRPVADAGGGRDLGDREGLGPAPAHEAVGRGQDLATVSDRVFPHNRNTFRF